MPEDPHVKLRTLAQFIRSLHDGAYHKVSKEYKDTVLVGAFALEVHANGTASPARGSTDPAEAVPVEALPQDVVCILTRLKFPAFTMVRRIAAAPQLMVET